MTPPIDDSVTTGTTEVDFVVVLVIGAMVVFGTVVPGAMVVVGEALGIDLAPTWEIPSTEVTRTNPTEVMIFFTVVFLQTPLFDEDHGFILNTKNSTVVVMSEDSHDNNFSL